MRPKFWLKLDAPQNSFPNGQPMAKRVGSLQFDAHDGRRDARQSGLVYPRRPAHLPVRGVAAAAADGHAALQSARRE